MTTTLILTGFIFGVGLISTVISVIIENRAMKQNIVSYNPVDKNESN